MLGFESAIATRSQSTLQPALPTNSGHFMKNLDQPHFYLKKKVIRRNRTMTLKIETEHWTANCSILVLFPQFQFHPVLYNSLSSSSPFARRGDLPVANHCLEAKVTSCCCAITTQPKKKTPRKIALSDIALEIVKVWTNMLHF